MPLDRVVRIVEGKPTTCAGCGTLLMGEVLHPVRHQIVDLPPVKPPITEYRQHTLKGFHCGALNRAESPEGWFGPRLQAEVSYRTGWMKMSHRDVQEYFAVCRGVTMGLSSITAIQQQ